MTLFIMVSTIYFDGEPKRRAIEIDSVTAERMLTAKA